MMDLVFFNDLFPPPQDERYLAIFIPASPSCKILKEGYADFLDKLRRRGFHPQIYYQAVISSLAAEVFTGEVLKELKIGLSDAFDVYSPFMNLNVYSGNQARSDSFGLPIFFWPGEDIFSFFEDYFEEPTVIIKEISSVGFYLTYLTWWPEVEIKVILSKDLA